MYCCRSGKRSGNLRRTIEVARKLSDTFDVTVLMGDAIPERIDFPDNIQTVLLPSLGIDADTNVFDIRRSQELRELIKARRNVLVREFERLKPRVVAIEDFPFRQHALRGEILPLVERARNGVYGDALVVAMTDGIFADDTERDDAHRDQTAQLLDKYFDMVIVHSDPVFARIEEFFQPQNVMRVPVYHTGFVSSENGAQPADPAIMPDTVLVSAGDGEHGWPLYRAAVEAHKILGSTLLLPMKIVAGDGLPEDEWKDLVAIADESPDLTVERTLPDIGAARAHHADAYACAVRALGQQRPASPDRSGPAACLLGGRAAAVAAAPERRVARERDPRAHALPAAAHALRPERRCERGEPHLPGCLPERYCAGNCEADVGRPASELRTDSARGTSFALT
jgi:predicted glycosyltransferase